jgi:tRNA-splicing ligase RtcB (3'-phosphate/5'-hydroxy nucleic acid ligase)
MSAPVEMWLAGSLSAEVRSAIQRLADAVDVRRVAVMPDVHLANAVCIGTATATKSRILPEAVGGDIGCGMLAVRFDVPATVLSSAEAAASLLSGLYRTVPFIKHGVRSAPELPAELVDTKLSATSLEGLKHRDGRLELGTLGRGNHFLEFQRDQSGDLWLMVHSGSRAMGPAIRDYHLRGTEADRGLRWLDAGSEHGVRYLADVAWARRYAEINRRTMFERIAELMRALFGAEAELGTLIDCDHNHVQRERHEGVELWVHRKGALHAAEGVAGVIPGSMGTASYHVVGRGEPSALCSSSHGAGRVMSRSDARRHIARKNLLADVEGIWFDHRLAERLREEAPSAYKEIGAVMRAQRELTRIVREVEPVLVYKGA